ncbi:MAG TPA: RES family NAD+ phosphorylase [Saprospiraceae bacterium]|nr:RES family NAD+ phosphorylase [Saprospiraceae bacterium]
MEVYRLCRKIYSGSLSGKGAALEGARWNSPGIEMIYTAMNRSLAMLEVAVHLNLSAMPDDYYILTIHIPDELSLKKLNLSSLPDHWNDFPYHRETQAIGDAFIKSGRYCLLQVPSAVTRGDFNLLINPVHPEFRRIRIVEREHFPFDKRFI